MEPSLQVSLTYSKQIEDLRDFIGSVAFLFDKLTAEAQDHPLRIAEITQEQCREFAANAYTILGE